MRFLITKIECFKEEIEPKNASEDQTDSLLILLLPVVDLEKEEDFTFSRKKLHYNRVVDSSDSDIGRQLNSSKLYFL